MPRDVFLSHASEDKEAVADPLYRALLAAKVSVWYDRMELTVGDSLRQKMDDGLGRAKFGIVVLSHAFFKKHWPHQELNALAQREVGGQKVILPIWYGVTRDDVMKYSPLLADRMAAQWKDGCGKVVEDILRGMGQTAEGFTLPLNGTANEHLRVTDGDSKKVQATAQQLVCFLSAKGDLGVFPLRSAMRSERLILEILAEDEKSSARIEQIFEDRNIEVGVAYQTTGVWGRAINKTQTVTNGVESWRVEIEDQTPKLHVMSEMSTTGHDADSIANLRARLILLGEKPTRKSGSSDRLDLLNVSMLESLVRGLDVRIKAVPLFSLLSADAYRQNPHDYCKVVRLLGIILLKLSFTIQDILKLDIKPISDDVVRVDFEGQRGRKFTNVDPAIVRVAGDVNVRKMT